MVNKIEEKTAVSVRDAQVELDRAIKHLGRKIKATEKHLGALQSLSVKTESTQRSSLNRLIRVGKVLVFLLPVSTLLGVAGGKNIDQHILKKDMHTQPEWTYEDMGGFLGVAGSLAWASKEVTHVLSKKSYHQTFIIAEYQKGVRTYFIYDLSEDETPKNMDKVILKRLKDYIQELSLNETTIKEGNLHE